MLRKRKRERLGKEKEREREKHKEKQSTTGSIMIWIGNLLWNGRSEHRTNTLDFWQNVVFRHFQMLLAHTRASRDTNRALGEIFPGKRKRKRKNVTLKRDYINIP